jgi:hypothetical protein
MLGETSSRTWTAFVDQWTRKTYSGTAEGERHEIKLRVVRAGAVVELPLVTVHRARW